MIAQNILEGARSAREEKAAASKDRGSDKTTTHTVPMLDLGTTYAPNPPLLDEYEDTEPQVESANTLEDA